MGFTQCTLMLQIKLHPACEAHPHVVSVVVNEFIPEHIILDLGHEGAAGQMQMRKPAGSVVLAYPTLPRGVEEGEHLCIRERGRRAQTAFD